MRFYETVRPLEIDIDNLKRSEHLLESQLAATGEDLIQIQKVSLNFKLKILNSIFIYFRH